MPKKYTACPGVGLAPLTVIKTGHYYGLRGGGTHWSAGRGLCSRCNRNISVKRDGMIGMHAAQVKPQPSVAEVKAEIKRLEAEKAEILEMFDQFTDCTFLLYHLLVRGYKHDDQLPVVKWALEDSIDMLRKYGSRQHGCPSCGSRHPESSNWHNAHCL